MSGIKWSDRVETSLKHACEGINLSISDIDDLKPRIRTMALSTFADIVSGVLEVEQLESQGVMGLRDIQILLEANEKVFHPLYTYDPAPKLHFKLH